MTVQLDHTIVHAHDKHVTARHLADLLGLPEPVRDDPFMVLTLGNGVCLDVADGFGEPHPQHYAFRVSDEEFDAVHARIRERDLPWWADPFHRRPREINTDGGGRGLYWCDPNGHNMEILTVPAGASGPR